MAELPSPPTTFTRPAPRAEGFLVVSSDMPPSTTDNDGATDPVILWKREVGRTPLLTPAEEITLAKQIAAGREAKKSLSQQTDMSAEEKTELGRIEHKGEEARNRIIKANTRLVMSIAKRYTGRGVPRLDLIQEGNLGLMRAVVKFDPERGCKFSTYATWWIRQAIGRAVKSDDRTVRLPVYIADKLVVLKRLSQELQQALGRLPTTDELEEALIQKQKGFSRKMAAAIINARKMIDVASLDEPIGDDDEPIDLYHYVADPNASNPEGMAGDTLLREKIEELLATLTPREARIIRLRFGLTKDGHRYTLDEVGHKFGLTRERIRQIEAEALARLRHPSRARQLKNYLL